MKIRIGGPNLSENQKTWYMNNLGAQVFVQYGDVVDVEQMRDGADAYVKRGQAEFVDEHVDVDADDDE